MAKSPKCYLLVDYSSSDESDASMDDSGKTRPDKTSTPRKEVKGKKRPALSQEEKKVITKLNYIHWNMCT
jgi:hypothetical protein